MKNKSKEETIKHRLRQRFYKAKVSYKKNWRKFRRYLGKYKKNERLVPINLKIDYNAIIKHLKPFPNDLSKYQIDHKIPLANFDFNKEKEIQIAFCPENHRWLLIKDNLKKGLNVDKRLRLLRRKI